MDIQSIIHNCESFIQKKGYASYDPFDALTNPLIDKLTRNKPLLRRVSIQVNSKLPLNVHWLGMKKMVHVKAISDLLWYYSVSNEVGKAGRVNTFFEWLLKLKNADGDGWGLNFPYTSRFIDAAAAVPNLYNTVNSGIAIAYSVPFLNDANKAVALKTLAGIVEFMETQLGYVDEGNAGWYLYYPGQKYPTYNVNALSVYFLAFVLKLNAHPDGAMVASRVTKLIALLTNEQKEDGSWVYSRSPKGGWVDGFHTGFVLESLAFAYKNGFSTDAVDKSIKAAWRFFIGQMFTSDGYPKYFSTSDKYPIEAQNCAQAIQTLANFKLWLGWAEDDLLKKVIDITTKNLYNARGFFYFKKTKYLTYKTPYIRWSVTPMMLALSYADTALSKV